MAKYDALREHLLRDGRPTIIMIFPEIEKLVGGLPRSAFTYDWWWDNEDQRTTRHMQCKAWSAAGYNATVDRTGCVVTFTRTR